MDFNIVKLMMEFSHEITADKIVIFRGDDDGRTLMKQIEDKINEQLRGPIL